jgi:acetyl-CoA C-acetyltransferase
VNERGLKTGPHRSDHDCIKYANAVIDGRTPVIVGVGQVTWRDGDAPEAVDLLAIAAQRAIADTGAALAAASISSIRIVRMLSAPYRDPGALLAPRIGAREGHTLYTGIGGQWPQCLVGRAAEDLHRGGEGVVLIGGAETWRTRLRHKARGTRMASTPQPAAPSDTILASTDADVELMTDAEIAAGIVAPVNAYALIESALRTKLGRTTDEHARAMAELWAGLSTVATSNPHAAVREAVPAARIRTADDGNRPVSSPYTKLLTANNHVDQAAAILMCTVDTAKRLGIDAAQWVYLHGASEASEVPYLSGRAELARSPALGAAGHAAIASARLRLDEIDHVDVYSCFPSAVQIAAAEVGLPLDRALTVTGGLTFAGGPWNNYVSHSLAAMVDRLRAHPGSYGMVTANGGLLTKHAFGVYSTRPAPDPPSVVRVPRAEAQVGLVSRFDGSATVEAATVAYDRDGPCYAIVAARTPDGGRTWARADDPKLIAAMVTEDLVGRAARIIHGTLLGAT